MIAFYTFTMLSYSVTGYIAACILRACFSVCMHFRQKLTKSANGNFQVCPWKQMRYCILALQLVTTWTKAEKELTSSSKFSRMSFVKNFLRVNIYSYLILSKKSNNLQHVLISIVGTSHHGSFRLLYIKKVEVPII